MAKTQFLYFKDIGRFFSSVIIKNLYICKKSNLHNSKATGMHVVYTPTSNKKLTYLDFHHICLYILNIAKLTQMALVGCTYVSLKCTFNHVKPQYVAHGGATNMMILLSLGSRTIFIFKKWIEYSNS